MSPKRFKKGEKKIFLAYTLYNSYNLYNLMFLNLNKKIISSLITSITSNMKKLSQCWKRWGFTFADNRRQQWMAKTDGKNRRQHRMATNNSDNRWLRRMATKVISN